jgi:hypothetical protein
VLFALFEQAYDERLGGNGLGRDDLVDRAFTDLCLVGKFDRTLPALTARPGLVCRLAAHALV